MNISFGVLCLVWRVVMYVCTIQNIITIGLEFTDTSDYIWNIKMQGLQIAHYDFNMSCIKLREYFLRKRYTTGYVTDT